MRNCNTCGSIVSSDRDLCDECERHYNEDIEREPDCFGNFFPDPNCYACLCHEECEEAKQQDLIDKSNFNNEEVATATENPTIPVRIRQNHLTNSPNGAMNGDA